MNEQTGNKLPKLWLGQRSRGFTLLEVVVSMALLAILAAGVLQSTALLRTHFEVMQSRWQRIIDKWNSSRRLRLE